MTPKIQETPAEQALFDLLRAAAEPHGVTLRAAGGWVRDKLLGIESHDIDIAIDKMTGEQFARVALKVPVSVIKANPEQSKQLETAKVRLAGFVVDLANLRDESGGGAYNDENRILQENVFAPAKLDATRRDFTVNALFYNVSTREVEDHVGGLYDLGFFEGKLCRKTFLRTPLDPKETFGQDPLRILRGLRLMSKIPDVNIDPQVIEAMSDPEVQRRFRDKLSPERIATELLGQWEEEFGERSYKRGIFNGERAPEALRLLDQTGLLDIILDVPLLKNCVPFDTSQNNRWHIYSIKEHTFRVFDAMHGHAFWKALNQSNPERAALLLFGALDHDQGKRHPDGRQLKDNGMNSYHGHEDISAKIVRQHANKLRLSNEATDYLVHIVGGHMDPHGEDWGSKDKTLRKFMARFPDCWEDIIVHAICDVMGKGEWRLPEIEPYLRNIERCRWLLVNDPVSPVTEKPALDGLILIGLIPELKQGPWLRDTVKRLNELRFEDPSITEEALIEKVKEWKPEIVADPQYAKFVK